jgi:hypothetical protein
MNDRDIMQQALDALEIAEVDGNCCYEATELLRTRLAQPEQEPVAWLDGPHLVVRVDMRDRLNYKGPWVDLGRAIPDKWTPLLYTAPPQRKPLTDEQIDELSRTMVKGSKSVNWLCRAIEVAHGIKERNT